MRVLLSPVKVANNKQTFQGSYPSGEPAHLTRFDVYEDSPFLKPLKRLNRRGLESRAHDLEAQFSRLTTHQPTNEIPYYTSFAPHNLLKVTVDSMKNANDRKDFPRAINTWHSALEHIRHQFEQFTGELGFEMDAFLAANRHGSKAVNATVKEWKTTKDPGYKFEIAKALGRYYEGSTVNPTTPPNSGKATEIYAKTLYYLRNAASLSTPYNEERAFMSQRLRDVVKTGWAEQIIDLINVGAIDKAMKLLKKA